MLLWTSGLDSTLKRSAVLQSIQSCCADIVALKSPEDATKFYDGKVEELGVNLKDLESIVQGKSNNLRVVGDGKLKDHTSEYYFTWLIWYACSLTTEGARKQFGLTKATGCSQSCVPRYWNT
jgi:hypothetical protein